MNTRSRYLPWIALVAVYLLWGSTFIGIRVAVSTIPPFLMAGSRYLIAGLLMLAIQWFVAKEKPKMPARKQLIRMAVTAFLLIVTGNAVLCFAETRVESGTAALLVASVPIFMLLFDALRAREVPAWTSIVGLIVGSGGMALLVGKGGAQGATAFAILIVLCSVSWALGTIYARHNEHHPYGASLEMAMGGVGALIAGFALGEGAQLHVAAISGQSLLAMLWLVTAGAMVGYTAYGFAVRTLPTPTVATYAYVNPVVAVILGALLLHEPVTWKIVAGGAAIVVSVIVILLGGTGKKREPQTLLEEAAA